MPDSAESFAERKFCTVLRMRAKEERLNGITSIAAQKSLRKDPRHQNSSQIQLTDLSIVQHSGGCIVAQSQLQQIAEYLTTLTFSMIRTRRDHPGHLLPEGKSHP